MNERIEQLANQLGPVATIGNWGRVEWANNVYPQLGDKMYAAIDLQKFAELIVRECALVVHKKTGPKSAWDVLQHFGVAEREE